MGTNFGIDIHPEAGDIQTRRYGNFSTLDIGSDLVNRASIFVDSRPILDALQAALDAIRADMDTAEGVFHGHSGGELPLDCPRCWEIAAEPETVAS